MDRKDDLIGRIQVAERYELTSRPQYPLAGLWRKHTFLGEVRLAGKLKRRMSHAVIARLGPDHLDNRPPLHFLVKLPGP